ncbi:hypothetical protein [Methylovirgula sp. HY1]|uniref:hypothetical protein n=1 Tax=Methylovirgula sp. HY1 TaxID=2822761 RepID=UPI001C5AC727|nr:hypothetical protein [Methylovirgula sp. HY1]QXX73882.1 hypothetical protein MHY1_00683 [Methylovirgula sp. HY1]
MSVLGRFSRHEGGSSFESLALALSVVAVLFVAGADLLRYASKKDGALAHFVAQIQAQVAQLSAPSQTLRGGIDYSPTGTIMGLRHDSSLSPCTGAGK